MNSISSIFIDCLRRFNDLITSNTLRQHTSEVPEDLWQDEIGRLRVWAANIGAHQTGQASLDYRLREASNIRDQTIRLLKGLQEAFDDLEEVLQEQEEGLIPVEDDPELEEMYGSEVQQIYKGIVNIIDCLYQMSMAIRRPAQHDRFKGIKKADSVPFVPYDQQHVENKFPGANSDVIKRLGVAISRRRAGLKYRERHHAKLSKGINSTSEDQSETGSTIFSETVATEFEVNQHLHIDETASDSGVSETSYAQTLLEGNDRITIPPPPKGSADGKPFECPYCFYVITIRDKRSWLRHVFTDLMPYVCVFPDCSAPAMLYASRREWYHHLQTSHLIQSQRDAGFDCPLCREELANTVRIDRHVGRHLEELALFALPRTDGGEDNDSTADTELGQIIEKSNSDQSDHDDLRLGLSAVSSAFSGGIEEWKRRVFENRAAVLEGDVGKDEDIMVGLERLIVEARNAKEATIAKVAAEKLNEREERERAAAETIIVEEQSGVQNTVKPRAVTATAEADTPENFAGLPTTPKLRAVSLDSEADEASENFARVPTKAKPTVVEYTKSFPHTEHWYCRICHDGPYPEWMTSCQSCLYRKS